MSRPLLAWHFLQNDSRLRFMHNGRINLAVYSGQTLKVNGKLKLGAYGLHASIQLLDALNYNPGLMLCRVEMSGKIIQGNDLVCAEERKVLWKFNCANVLHLFACDVAKRFLEQREKQFLSVIKLKHRLVKHGFSFEDFLILKDKLYKIHPTPPPLIENVCAFSASRAVRGVVSAIYRRINNREKRINIEKSFNRSLVARIMADARRRGLTK